MNSAVTPPAAAEPADPASGTGSAGSLLVRHAAWRSLPAWSRWALAIGLIAAATLAFVSGRPGAPTQDATGHSSSRASAAGPSAVPEADAQALRRAATLLVAPLTALDPIDRTLALREWESALGVRLRWAQVADREALSADDQIRMLAGEVVQGGAMGGAVPKSSASGVPAPAGLQVFVAVPRVDASGVAGPVGSGSDVLIVEAPVRVPASNQGLRALPWMVLAGALVAAGLFGWQRRRAGLRARPAEVWVRPAMAEGPSDAADAASAAPVAFEALAVEAPAPEAAAAPPLPSYEASEAAAPPPLPTEDGFDLVGLLRREVEALRRQTAAVRDPSADDRQAGTLLIDFDPWVEGAIPHQPALLARAVRGLLGQAADRAHRHVVLSVRHEGGRVLIEIDDDGESPGIGIGTDRSAGVPDDAEWVFAETVAQWHGGQASAGRAPLGGIRRVIAWPLPASGRDPRAPDEVWPPGLRRDRRAPATARGRRRSDLGYT